MRIKLLTTIAAVAALAAAWPAAAQAPGGPTGSEPMDIEADELETLQSQCVLIWRGRAEALQAGARLRADVMTAHLEKKSGGGAGEGGNCGNVQTVEAKGTVYYVSAQGDRARGDTAFYDAANNTVTMTGDVVAVQGKNVLRGSRMVWNTKTGEGRMQGQATGRNKSGRVRGVFYPDQDNARSAKR
ncbi:LptA/OstA family protein [Phenylobacterium sp.]|jgi:lipopolysaccharide export system protein LptA|uniref:LptA/OstA family protein n=1 Tax=Phenylobacterium sp. TaxID=1871053 RepID=UPI002F9486F4